MTSASNGGSSTGSPTGSGGNGTSSTGHGASTSATSSTGHGASTSATSSTGHGASTSATSSTGHGTGGSGAGTGGTGAGTGGTGAGTGGGATDAGPDGSGCASDEKQCNGMCVKIDDPAYGCSPTSCTACGPYANGTAACSAGACALGTCNNGFKNCDGNDANGCEVNITNDPMQCGACGAPCVVPNATAACTNGACTVGTCNSGWTDCNNDPTDGCEANLQNDPTNCGTCNTACPGLATCQAGACGVVCAAGTADCNMDPTDGCETTLFTNQNCAFCGDVCSPANATGNCVNMSGTGTCTVVSCNAGFADCDMVAANGCEVNDQTDANNCGTCGNKCPSGPNSTAVCNTGSCAIVCDPGYKDCDGNPNNGCEVHTAGDTANCGSCGNACTTPNGTPGCVAGTCTVASCTGTFLDCNMQVADGCETDVSTSPSNCGSCGNVCNVPNATAGCAGGSCTVGTCNAGFMDCDNNASNGCETNTGTDTNNCGSCGNVCTLAHATSACAGGACNIANCSAGYQDCDNSPADGCEVNTNTDLNNCGGCGHVCNLPNAMNACNGGNCAINNCNTGFGDCDGNAANGCEVNTTTDPNNCGGCGMACSLPNATPGCSASKCTVASCNAGFANCDANAANGCETNTNTDTNNCGACGNKCALPNTTADSCTGGACGIVTCSTNFANCDNHPANGCEVNTSTDPNNCGACGSACSLPNATPGCAASKCTVASCSTGFANCDGNAANGCEVNTQTDVNNCGGCGNVCNLPNAAAACMAGKCVVASCNAGFKDCDGNPANGCEVNDNTDPNNCGACGNACKLPNATPGCFAGACTVASCNTGFADCDGLATNGCEINTKTDPNNCGGCNDKCAVANGTAGCAGGACTVAGCNTGFANCDGNAGNGCEVTLATDNNNCGSCGNSCTADCGGAGKGVSTTACSAGACSITACAAGYQDTDKTCSDGCECALSSTPTACSAAAAHSLGTIGAGGNPVAFTSNLFPATPNAAYFTVTFTGNTTTSTFHPLITLTDPDGEFVMDITSDCSTLISNCNVSGSGNVSTTSGVTTWETSYTAGDPNSKTAGGASNFVPITLDASGQVYIKVYRKNPNVVVNCDNDYTLTVAN